MYRNIFSVNGLLRPTLARYSAPRGAQLGYLRFMKADGTGREAITQACIINSIDYFREVACAPEPTLGGRLYINFFGDKPTQYSVAGVAFDTPSCDFGVDPLAALIHFYDEYKLSTFTGHDIKKQVTITTYNTLQNVSMNYVGILTGMRLITTGEQNGIKQYQFTFTFLALK